MLDNYRYSISFTSQFPFCSVPLRLDAYSKCQFACRYCFAAARGGKRPSGSVQIASPARLASLLVASQRGRGGALGELLRAGVPVHFGGMADPFPPMEAKVGVSYALLGVLADHQYPTIVSAKGIPHSMSSYVEVIRRGRMMVQFSFTVIDPSLSSRVDAGAPTVEERFEFMRTLSREGVPVTMRLQPVFPGHEAHAQELIELGADAGAKHVAVEFLKYPVESSWSGIKRLGSFGSNDLISIYREAGAALVAREWVMPPEYRAPRALEIKLLAKKAGLTFAFADNDLLHFSDGEACCTAADIYLGVSGLGFNFHRAAKRSSEDGRIDFAAIEDEWRPVGSFAQYLNSRSRSRGRTVEEQITSGWNSSAYSPGNFFGVSHHGEVDASGRKVYMIDLVTRSTYAS